MGLEGNRFASSTKSMEVSVSGDPSIFPGFRFSPTDEELISYYLKKKLEGTDSCVEVIPEIEIWKYEPWDLPAKAVIQSENEWFFFSPRGRKYPNGSQSRRATESGYWKATGKERNVKAVSSLIGTKRTLVFHTGRAPKGQRTEWLMHEYCMSGNFQDSLVVCRLRKNTEFNLNDRSKKRSTKGRELDDDYATSSAIGVKIPAGGNHVGECGSKDGSNSCNSHSGEQTDWGYESDDKAPSEFSQQNSRLKMSGNCEEDCFADIMKDDIIKLDDSSLRMAPESPPMVSRIFESNISSNQPVQAMVSRAIPSQGTANRRLRLRKPKVEINDKKYLICKQDHRVIPEHHSSTFQKFLKAFGSFVSNVKTRRLAGYSCLGMVIMIIMCISVLGNYRLLKNLMICYLH